MFKPDGSFCDKARSVLTLTEQNNKELQFSAEFSEILKSLETKKRDLESEINSEKSQEIINKSQDFFQVQVPKNIIIKIFLLFHIGEGIGGTFCKGDDPIMFLRVSFEQKPMMNVIYHEFMHYLDSLSKSFKIKRDAIVQNIKILESIKMSARTIIDEGTVYVAEPLITERKIAQSNIDMRQLGGQRAWGKFRMQTINNRKYSDLDGVMNSIPKDWERFVEEWKKQEAENLDV